ncbi:MAG: NADH-quinone oxidoreductase subunit J [Planctomycetaceae bacterium]
MTVGELLFLLFALATCGGAIAVAVSQNVVRMAFWLIVTLGSTSGLFFLLHADFVAAAQLLIYVGGTVVLLIFGVMLTASGPYVRIKTSPAEGFLAAGIGALFLAMIFSTVYSIDWAKLSIDAQGGMATHYPEPIAAEGATARPIGLKLIGVSTEDLGKDGDGKLSTGYLLPFEIVSIHLLVVLIGAAYLARAKRRVDPTADAAGRGV